MAWARKNEELLDTRFQDKNLLMHYLLYCLKSEKSDCDDNVECLEQLLVLYKDLLEATSTDRAFPDWTAVCFAMWSKFTGDKYAPMMRQMYRVMVKAGCKVRSARARARDVTISSLL